MGDLAIHVENLSKLYRIGPRERYKTLRESLTDTMYAPFRRLRSAFHRSNFERANGNDTIWALKDVSFEAKRGEVVGIIGRNGAGKTTLLKILSRITEPTEGRAEIYGRVGSLLEVGTGFHPELTGRENIYLNGAILGMKRTEIKHKFDEIVAFAEIERFLDTPVKRYSSGMYVRLAFAVAAHLEPEILLVDEVLAVGDATFQKKCLAKMQAVGSEGRTVLFVSHNMLALTTLCPRTILLQQGMVVLSGPTAEVVGRYLSDGTSVTAKRVWPQLWEAPGDEVVRLRAICVCDKDGQMCEIIDIREKVGIRFEYDVLEPGHILTPTFSLHTDTGVLAFWAGDTGPEWRGRPRPVGRYISTAWIPGNFLSAGTMTVGVTITSIEARYVHFHEQEVLSFQVMDYMGADTARGDYKDSLPGAVRPLLPWTNQFHPSERIT